MSSLRAPLVRKNPEFLRQNSLTLLFCIIAPQPFQHATNQRATSGIHPKIQTLALHIYFGDLCMELR